MTPEPRYVAKAAVATRDVGGDLVLLDMDDGQYYSLNKTGALIWRSAATADGSSLETMVGAIVDAYEVDESAARDDIEAVLQQLIDQGLVTAR